MVLSGLEVPELSADDRAHCRIDTDSQSPSSTVALLLLLSCFLRLLLFFFFLVPNSNLVINNSPNFPAPDVYLCKISLCSFQQQSLLVLSGFLSQFSPQLRPPSFGRTTIRSA